MLRAGLWPAARHLVVALQGPGPGRTRLHLRVARTLDGRNQLAAYLARERYLEVVLPEPLHRFDPIAEHLVLHRVRVWLVPGAVLDDLLALLDVRPSAHVTIASALARLPARPLLRGALRELAPPDPRQLCLRIPRFA